MPIVRARTIERIFNEVAAQHDIAGTLVHCRQYENDWWSVNHGYYERNLKECTEFWDLVNNYVKRHTSIRIEIGGFQVQTRDGIAWQGAFRYHIGATNAAAEGASWWGE